MRKALFLAILAIVSLGAQAQTPAAPAQTTAKFAYFSYEAALKAMPEYANVQKNMESLRAKYEAEAKRSEDDFNAKYEEFLDGQSDFPTTIRQKRQAELQELMDKNIAFKAESRRLLQAAEAEAMAPLHAKLKAKLKAIGEKRGYAFIINTDNNACPYINPAQGEDISLVISDK